ISSLINAGVREEQVTFGRAAKLIAVYLKSVVVLGTRGSSSLSKVAHPPIDGILLSKIAKSSAIHSVHKAKWGRKRWTRLKEDEYYELVEQLRASLAPDVAF